jgi:arylsulfatase A-like enzyme
MNSDISNLFLKNTIKGITACSFATGMYLSTENLSAAEQPNVVIVQADDQGMGDWSWFGEHPYLSGKTPNIEKIAKEGVFMTNFHAMPLCAPSRAALQTGRHSYFSRVWQGRHLMRAGLPTIANLFKENGYKTAILGKWHLGHEYPYGPEFRGYEESIIMGGGMFMTLEDYSTNNGMTLTDLTLRHNGKFEKFKGYSTDIWFNEAIKFITKNKENKFFVLITPDAPHAPHVPPKRYKHTFDNIKEFKDLQGKTVNQANTVRGFYGQIVGLDEEFGKLRAKIKELGLEDNTIIIYCSDNGSAVAANIYNGSATHYPKVPLNLTAGKAQSQEGGHREPFFVYWKGHIGGGKINNELVHNIDIIPTLIELCNLKKTPFNNKYLEGQSFAQLLLNPEKTFDNHNYFRFATYCPIYDAPTAKGGVVMYDNFRMFAYGALFDISKDITQNYQYKGPDAKKIKDKMFNALNKEQELFNNDIFPFYDAYYVGSDKHPITQISAIDWNVNHPAGFWGDLVHWDDKNRARFGNYLIKPIIPGIYKISLYRWYPYENKGINEISWNSKPLNATAARLVIKDAGIDTIKNISVNPVSISFEVNLPRKILEVDAKFLDAKGNPILSAYFLRIERIQKNGNRKPVALRDSYNTLEGKSISIPPAGLLINDSDADADKVIPVVVKNVSNGSLQVNSDGSFKYTPNKGFTGIDEFTYKLNDGNEDGNTVPVKLNVLSTKINAPLFAHWKLDKSETQGSIIKDETGNYNGQAKNGVKITESGPLGSCATFDKTKKQFILLDKEVSINNSNFTVSTFINLKSYTTNGMDNRSIFGGDGIAWVIGSDGKQHLVIPGKPGLTMQIKSSKTKIPLNSWVHIAVTYNNTNGVYNYYINGKLNGSAVWEKHFSGNIKFIGKENNYFGFFDGKIDDFRIYKSVLNDSQIITLSTLGANSFNHKPIARVENYTVTTGNTLNVNVEKGVMINDIDLDKDSLTVKTAALPLYGKLKLNKDGSFSYIPNKGFSGIDTFDYCVTDGIALSNVVTVGIKVEK